MLSDNKRVDRCRYVATPKSLNCHVERARPALNRCHPERAAAFAASRRAPIRLRQCPSHRGPLTSLGADSSTPRPNSGRSAQDDSRRASYLHSWLIVFTPCPRRNPSPATQSATPISQKSRTKKKVEVLSSKTVFRGRIFRVDVDRVREPSGVVVRRDVVRHGGSVVILAVDDCRPGAARPAGAPVSLRRRPGPLGDSRRQHGSWRDAALRARAANYWRRLGIAPGTGRARSSFIPLPDLWTRP